MFETLFDSGAAVTRHRAGPLLEERERYLCHCDAGGATRASQRLPRLATYLGHASISSTQQYLHMTPELLHEANLRFADYAQLDADKEINHAQ